FHAIAASHGVAGVYGPCNSAEWNHMQGAKIKMTTPELRATFTSKGDIAPDLPQMWKTESSVVLDVAKPVASPGATERRGSPEAADSDTPSHHARAHRRHRGDDDDDDD